MWMCVCVYLNVLGAYASHHIFILGAAPCSFHTHTQTRTLVIFVTSGACSLPGRLSSRLRFLTAFSSVCPGFVCACLYFYLSVCLLCEVRPPRLFFNCFLPPTGPKYREAQQYSLCLESVDREKETEFVPTLHNQSSILYVFIHIVYFNQRTLVHFQSGWATYKSKASSYLQLSHLCSWE